MQRPAGGLGAIGSAVVLIAVFAIVMMGMVALAQRDAFVAQYEARVAAAEIDSAARLAVEREVTSRPTPSPTPLPTPQPVVSAGQHLVGTGESLFSVATVYGVSADELVYWNASTYPTLYSTPALEPGWVLAVVGPALPTPQPTIAPTPRPPPESAVANSPWEAAFYGASPRFFDIHGASRNELHNAMITAGSEVCQSSRAAACAGAEWWDFVPSYSQQANGSCTIASVELRWELVVWFPRWVDDYGTSPTVTLWWQRTAAAIAAHEQRHIDTWLAAVPELHAMTSGIPCSSYSSAIDSWIAIVDSRHDVIDGH